jgi:hypothetical protein
MADSKIVYKRQAPHLAARKLLATPYRKQSIGCDASRRDGPNFKRLTLLRKHGLSRKLAEKVTLSVSNSRSYVAGYVISASDDG